MEIIRGKQPGAQKVVLYGPEGIGKSTFASHFPEPLYIDTEGSTRHMDVARLPAPSSWSMLLEQVTYVRDHPDCCKTLVIDTMDWAETLCTKYVCDRAQKAGVEDFGYGKGFTYVGEEFGKLLNLLEEVIARGIHVVGLAHAAMRKFEQPDEMGAYDRWEMKLSRKVCPMVKEWADAVLFANYKTITVRTKEDKVKAQGGRRVMYTAHHPCWDAKNRWGLPEETDFSFEVVAPHLGTTVAATTTVATSAPVYKPLELVSPSQNPADAIIEEDEPEPQEQTTLGINPNIPKALADLMVANNVTEEELKQVVAQNGYYPEDTPIERYDPRFVNGSLVAAWQKVMAKILNNRDLPFC